MYAFNEGDRVRYVGIEGHEWNGREGVVEGTYRESDGERVMVLFEGDSKALSFLVESFEPVKETYTIKNESEDYSIAVMELTDSEAALIKKLVAELDRDVVSGMQPRLTIKKEKK